MPAGPQAQPTPPTPAAAAKAASEELTLARATYRRMMRTIEADGRYPAAAFRFLQEGLEYTVRRVHGETALNQAQGEAAPGKDDPRHVGGADLCLGLRELALDRWGRLARAVLHSWNLFGTRDFGEMVFVLVDGGFLQKTDHDRVDDFADVYKFADLEADYRLDCQALHGDAFDSGDDLTPLAGGHS